MSSDRIKMMLVGRAAGAGWAIAERAKRAHVSRMAITLSIVCDFATKPSSFILSPSDFRFPERILPDVRSRLQVVQGAGRHGDSRPTCDPIQDVHRRRQRFRRRAELPGG